jgi:hypothetical protein
VFSARPIRRARRRSSAYGEGIRPAKSIRGQGTYDAGDVAELVPVGILEAPDDSAAYRAHPAVAGRSSDRADGCPATGRTDGRIGPVPAVGRWDRAGDL